MTDAWTPRETNTHQDHVIAHVLGTTVPGYFIFDEAIYILLDIGFMWTIFLDGEMALMPHPVAINELDVDEPTKEAIKVDIDQLLGNQPASGDLLRMIPGPLHSDGYPCEISEVSFFEQGEQRRLVISGGAAAMVIETSLTTAEIQVYDLEQQQH